MRLPMLRATCPGLKPAFARRPPLTRAAKKSTPACWPTRPSVFPRRRPTRSRWVPWTWSGKLESYCSRGPTDENRAKPDLSSYHKVGSVAFGQRFAGTSAACPHVSGIHVSVIDVPLREELKEKEENALNSLIECEEKAAKGITRVEGDNVKRETGAIIALGPDSGTAILLNRLRLLREA